jgi:hypothetical protein
MQKKTDEENHPKEIHYVGLPANEPPNLLSCPLSSHPFARERNSPVTSHIASAMLCVTVLSVNWLNQPIVRMTAFTTETK